MRYFNPTLTTLFCIVCLALPLSIANAGNNAGAAFNFWPDTGQDKCYTNNSEMNDCPSEGRDFYGQDANYQGPRGYTKLGMNGVILPANATAEDGWLMTRDNVTGLVWEVKTTDESIHNGSKKFFWCDRNDETNGGHEGTCSDIEDVLDTEAFITKLNEENFGGFSDWRMPTVKELATIVDLGADAAEPAIDSTFFPNTLEEEYWSATTAADEPSEAWFVNFQSRWINTNIYKGDDPKWNALPIRAVRGGQPVSAERFIDNGDGTITDVSTSLMWQKCTMGQTYDPNTGQCSELPMDEGYYTWKEALELCENLNLANFTDWRLPNRNELQSLADYSRTYPVFDPEYFAVPYEDWDPFFTGYWTSSTIFDVDSNGDITPINALYIDLYKGMSGGYDKLQTDFLLVRAVRTIETDGDYDYDDDYDGDDQANLALYLTGEYGYDPAFDLNQDHSIDDKDVCIFACRFGKSPEEAEQCTCENNPQ